MYMNAIFTSRWVGEPATTKIISPEGGAALPDSQG